ncbi:DUF4386 domain-containing protein [Paenibacillus koleovorans]|uniref:DUF4386 domain-containing protein n=1 Tax=Paenibacillus koleovorans TaxID=121608 RepID=UPI000FD9DDA5|nr:DUF4386 domain-containing protein [Paenibacillus koleovorans]
MVQTQTHSRNHLSRLLGAAFLIQAFTSLISGALFLNPLVDPENIKATMLEVGSHAGLVHASLLGDTVTAIGIVWLAAMLYTVAGQANKGWALTALGLYILEAGILIVSKIAAFVLLEISQEYAATGDPTLERLAALALAAKDFAYRLHIIPFGIGAIIFYYLLLKSNVVPRWLSLWGLTTVPLVLFGAIWITSGAFLPPALLALALPYVPFEFFAGIYLLVKGFQLQPGRD